MNNDDYANAAYWGLSRHVNCGNCVHRPSYVCSSSWEPQKIYFPDDVCPFQCDDPYYNDLPAPDFFCAAFKMKGGEKRLKQLYFYCPF